MMWRNKDKIKHCDRMKTINGQERCKKHKRWTSYGLFSRNELWIGRDFLSVQRKPII